jgi:Fic family protein
MKIENFVSGTYKQQYEYRSFTPATVKQHWTWEDSSINILLEEANRKLGAFDAFATYIPDIEIYIKMHVVKEATKSSMIEGTRTNVEDAVRKKNEILPKDRDDWQEVQNYIRAMNISVDRMTELPLSTRLLKEAHTILMQGVRGEHRNPGEYRRSQNWIGGATLKDAVFIPPSHEEVDELMGDLENFIHNKEIQVPVLIKTAIAHYQFETIHPFLDGNGRIGRLLIILMLVESGVLKKPALYLSEFFERNRNLYYDNLNNVREYNKLGQWIKFFLTGVVETSTHGISTFENILKLKEEIDGKKLKQLGRKLPKAQKLIKYLFKNPIIISQDVKEALNISLPTANSLLANFEDLGILKEITGWKRNREFEFTDYLKLFR